MPRDIDRLGRIDGETIGRSDLAAGVMVQGMPVC
jgi:hypothetical protein